jgi:MFS family permease
VQNPLAVTIGVVQLLFATTWTVYVVYLPQLAEQAGIARAWVPWILAADQLIFALCDVATGFWLDRVRASLARFGGWILGVTVVSGIAFLGLPFIGASPALLLAAIVVWAVTSSALRSPPWALLGRHAAKPAVPWLSALVLTGTAVAGAVAPYLGMALRGVDPRVPFVVSTLTLLAAVVVLVIAERRLTPSTENPGVEADRRETESPLLFFIALLVMAYGFQIHFSLNSAPQFLRFAKPADLAWLLPVFWIGFNFVMFPASRTVKRWGALAVMTLAAAAGAIATLACALAPGLYALLAAQFVAGGCWGAACVAAYTWAVDAGRSSRQGRFLGTLFAMFAIATLSRIALNASGFAALPEWKGLLPWLPEMAWLAAGLLLLLTSARGRAPTTPGSSRPG